MFMTFVDRKASRLPQASRCQDREDDQMKAIIHIGLAKTGSSTIQAFLDKNKTQLLEQSVRFERSISDLANNVEFAVAARALTGEEVPKDALRHKLHLKSAADHQAFFDRFEADFSARRAGWQEELFIGSSEQISAWAKNPRHIQALDRFLLRHFSEVRYVVYLRRQEEIILSSYSERIKRGDTECFEDHLEKRLITSLFKTVRLWANTVGSERLFVRLLERDYLKGGDLLQDFCAHAGIEDVDLSRPQTQNESLSAWAAERLRRLNVYMPPFRASGRRSFGRRRILQILMKLSVGKPRQQLTAAQHQRVRDANAEENEKLRRAWFSERDVLFAERTPESGS